MAMRLSVGGLRQLNKACVRVAVMEKGVTAVGRGMWKYTSRDLHTTTATPSYSKLPRLQHTISESYEQVEVSTAEWPYVERLLPYTTIPKPSSNPGEVTPSGWVAPSAQPGDYPYFVPRAASHMMPVYVEHEPILNRFVTRVKHVEGDIFALGEELQEHLTRLFPSKYIILRVHEPHQVIHIKGQFVGAVKEFLFKKGF
ncbi:39S ribosomal protein L49, mitochondrial-like [Homarus americanus]|uniref:Large ribosomal subunit protein mL49 n=1 Tax=Homarus americanus TaxID=6706 RepID=A0A8J5JUZ4_HOMAM|nr:39S ribosomal protein L49, mitochondrial-like [Homarus americanus]KAG7161579.1 39S ribosomal protein L49-like [Homarus americanus]